MMFLRSCWQKRKECCAKNSLKRSNYNTITIAYEYPFVWFMNDR